LEFTETIINDLQAKLSNLRAEMNKVVVGQESTIESLIIALLADGNILLEGVPGLGKTLLVKTFAKCISLDYKRIQFTPDLMPSDVIGTDIIREDSETGKRHFEFVKGPLFSNIVLGDEINRTPPKTQAALLEAMQEKSISYAGKIYHLDRPYIILATQNPIEQSGTYDLPEAQKDRFLLKVNMDYPNAENELKILLNDYENEVLNIQPVINKEEILNSQKAVKQIHVNHELAAFVNKLVRNTRPENSEIDFIKKWVQFGAGPRAGLALIASAKAKAFLNGRLSVVKKDILELLESVLQHRIVLNFEAESDNISKKDVLEKLVT